MQSQRKSAYQTHKLGFELSEVINLMHLYRNNRALSANELGSILTTLEEVYWQGKISSQTLISIQSTFFPTAILPTAQTQVCPVLSMGFELTGRVIQTRYLLQEVIGFVDAGVIFRASDIAQGAAGGGEITSILCLLSSVEPYVSTLEDVSNQIATTNLSNCVFAQNIIKDKGQTFVLLPALKGLPLSCWLADREISGTEDPYTTTWLRQFGRWIRDLESYPLLRKSLHPGHVWVDPQTHTLTALLLPLPESLLTADTRTTRYCSAALAAHPKAGVQATYQLMAIGYELYSGSLPDNSQFKSFFEQAKTLPKRTARALEKVLLNDQPISWRSAWGKLGISKVGLYCQRGMFVSATLIAIFVGVDTGMRYWPQIKAYVAPDVGETTVVLTPQTKDQHVNSLKAAFFNQVAERDIVGARASLQALQQLLPSDDIFIQKVAPQQLAESYLQAAQQVAESDRLAAGLLVRAAERLAPDLPDLKAPEVVAMQLSSKELASLTAETEREEAAIAQSNVKSQPATETLQAQKSDTATETVAPTTATLSPQSVAKIDGAEIFDGTHDGKIKIKPIAGKSAEEVGLKADPCANAFQRKGKSSLVHCADALDQKQLAPRLIVMAGKSKNVPAFAITQQPIALADYQIYCKQTPGCKMATNAPMGGKSGLKLDDVAAEIQKYNEYCIETGACAALSSPSYVSLGTTEIQAYIQWLSRTTGYAYRLPTEKEWAYLNESLSKGTNALHWGMVFPSKTEWVQTGKGEAKEVKSPLQTTDKNNQVNGVVFRVVRELK